MQGDTEPVEIAKEPDSSSQRNPPAVSCIGQPGVAARTVIPQQQQQTEHHHQRETHQVEHRHIEAFE